MFKKREYYKPSVTFRCEDGFLVLRPSTDEQILCQHARNEGNEKLGQAILSSYNGEKN